MIQMVKTVLSLQSYNGVYTSKKHLIYEKPVNIEVEFQKNIDNVDDSLDFNNK